MSSSIHDKLNRVRKPRVHITYDVETEGAEIQRELPFEVGVMGDFSGDPTTPLKPIADRKFVQIDRDNFNDVMASMTPGLKLKVDNKLAEWKLSNGSFGWDGLYGTQFWVNPKDDIVTVLMIQTTVGWYVQRPFENAVMDAIEFLGTVGGIGHRRFGDLGGARLVLEPDQDREVVGAEGRQPSHVAQQEVVADEDVVERPAQEGVVRVERGVQAPAAARVERAGDALEQPRRPAPGDVVEVPGDYRRPVQPAHLPSHYK